MFNKFFLTGIIATLVLSYGSIETYSAHHKEKPLTENTGDPATEDLRRDPKKKYVEEVQPYVGEAGNDVKYLTNEEDAETLFTEDEKDFGVEHPLNED